jgi:hypothetical protein
MASYELRILSPEANAGAAPAMQIDARSPHEALMIAQKNTGPGHSELWEGERRLARLKNVGTATVPVWQIY